MKKPKGLMRARSIAFVVLTLFLLFQIQDAVKGSTLFYLPVQMPADVKTPLVTLQNMTSDSTIYANSTSARITVADNTTVDVLEILNQTNDAWQLQLLAYNDTDVSRLANCTIWFHDGSASVQIRITDGNYSQMSGQLYDFDVNSRIAITATAITQGISFIHAFLKIIHPETSTYFLYVITFEIAS